MESGDKISKKIQEYGTYSIDSSSDDEYYYHVRKAESVQSLIPSNRTDKHAKKIEVKSFMPSQPDCVIVPCDIVDNPSCSELKSDKAVDIPLGNSGRAKSEDGSPSFGEEIPNLKSNIGIRSLIAFWLLGLCNNYGYVVMLSAAHDILANKHHDVGIDSYMPVNATTTPVSPTVNPNPRDCNTLSTGAILLADIIPSLLIKMTAPFFPLYIHFRFSLMVIFSIAGYVLVGASVEPWMAICGVIATAISSGVGEASILSYMAFYKDKGVISSWSSGTGGAGFFGSLSYAFLISIGLSPAATLYSLCSIPVLMAITFWFVLKHPQLEDNSPSQPNYYDYSNEAQVHSYESADHSSSLHDSYSDEVPLETTKDTFLEKLIFIPNLFKYMIPIGLVYLFEYFINQGLLELVFFRGVWLTHSEQYRWYQVLYQIGVFISRSSLRLIQINHLWLLGVLQFINAAFFVVQSIYSIIPNLYVIMLIVLWEGLLGGAAYVNTFHKISVEVTASKREFSMAITSLADALGITIAALSAFPVHNYICNLPLY